MVFPNLVDTELADIYHLPTFRRIHSSINASLVPLDAMTKPRPAEPGATRSGLIMSLHLDSMKDGLALVMGFEDGRLELWTCPTENLDKNWDGRVSGERLWIKRWAGTGHNEAGQSDHT